MAERYGLLKTGGSDFHSKGHGAMLGSIYVPYSYLQEMKKHKSGEREIVPRQYHNIDSDVLEKRYCHFCYADTGELNVTEQEEGMGEFCCTVCELG